MTGVLNQSSPAEIDDSLRRLRTDYIDIYQGALARPLNRRVIHLAVRWMFDQGISEKAGPICASRHVNLMALAS